MADTSRAPPTPPPGRCLAWLFELLSDLQTSLSPSSDGELFEGRYLLHLAPQHLTQDSSVDGWMMDDGQMDGELAG